MIGLGSFPQSRSTQACQTRNALFLESETNVATQAVSFVSDVSVVTDQASIDRLRTVVVRVGSELDDQLPVDASCG
jgi:hypothetical protein